MSLRYEKEIKENKIKVDDDKDDKSQFAPGLISYREEIFIEKAEKKTSADKEEKSIDQDLLESFQKIRDQLCEFWDVILPLFKGDPLCKTIYALNQETINFLSKEEESKDTSLLEHTPHCLKSDDHLALGLVLGTLIQITDDIMDSIKCCDFLVMTKAPTVEDLDPLPITGNIALIRFENKLFYVNKLDKQCIEAVGFEEKRQDFDSILDSDKLTSKKILPFNLLKQIEQLKIKGLPTLLNLTLKAERSSDWLPLLFRPYRGAKEKEYVDHWADITAFFTNVIDKTKDKDTNQPILMHAENHQCQVGTRQRKGEEKILHVNTFIERANSIRSSLLECFISTFDQAKKAEFRDKISNETYVAHMAVGLRGKPGISCIDGRTRLGIDQMSGDLGVKAFSPLINDRIAFYTESKSEFYSYFEMLAYLIHTTWNSTFKADSNDALYKQKGKLNVTFYPLIARSIRELNPEFEENYDSICDQKLTRIQVVDEKELPDLNTRDKDAMYLIIKEGILTAHWYQDGFFQKNILEKKESAELNTVLEKNINILEADSRFRQILLSCGYHFLSPLMMFECLLFEPWFLKNLEVNFTDPSWKTRLIDMNYTAMTLSGNDLSKGELNFGIDDFVKLKWTISECKNKDEILKLGFSKQFFDNEKWTESQKNRIGFTPQILKKKGFAIKDLTSLGFKFEEIKPHFAIRKFIEEGYDRYSLFVDAGFTKKEIMATREFQDFSIEKCFAEGYGIYYLLKLGFTKEEIIAIDEFKTEDIEEELIKSKQQPSTPSSKTSDKKDSKNISIKSTSKIHLEKLLKICSKEYLDIIEYAHSRGADPALVQIFINSLSTDLLIRILENGNPNWLCEHLLVVQAKLKTDQKWGPILNLLVQYQLDNVKQYPRFIDNFEIIQKSTQNEGDFLDLIHYSQVLNLKFISIKSVIQALKNLKNKLSYSDILYLIDKNNIIEQLIKYPRNNDDNRYKNSLINLIISYLIEYKNSSLKTDRSEEVYENLLSNTFFKLAITLSNDRSNDETFSRIAFLFNTLKEPNKSNIFNTNKWPPIILQQLNISGHEWVAAFIPNIKNQPYDKTAHFFWSRYQQDPKENKFEIFNPILRELFHKSYKENIASNLFTIYRDKLGLVNLLLFIANNGDLIKRLLEGHQADSYDQITFLKDFIFPVLHEFLTSNQIEEKEQGMIAVREILNIPFSFERDGRRRLIFFHLLDIRIESTIDMSELLNLIGKYSLNIFSKEKNIKYPNHFDEKHLIEFLTFLEKDNLLSFFEEFHLKEKKLHSIFYHFSIRHTEFISFFSTIWSTLQEKGVTDTELAQIISESQVICNDNNMNNFNLVTFLDEKFPSRNDRIVALTSSIFKRDLLSSLCRAELQIIADWILKSTNSMSPELQKFYDELIPQILRLTIPESYFSTINFSEQEKLIFLKKLSKEKIKSVLPILNLNSAQFSKMVQLLELKPDLVNELALEVCSFKDVVGWYDGGGILAYLAEIFKENITVFFEIIKKRNIFQQMLCQSVPNFNLFFEKLIYPFEDEKKESKAIFERISQVQILLQKDDVWNMLIPHNLIIKLIEKDQVTKIEKIFDFLTEYPPNDTLADQKSQSDNLFFNLATKKTAIEGINFLLGIQQIPLPYFFYGIYLLQRKFEQDANEILNAIFRLSDQDLFCLFEWNPNINTAEIFGALCDILFKKVSNVDGETQSKLERLDQNSLYFADSKKLFSIKRFQWEMISPNKIEKPNLEVSNDDQKTTLETERFSLDREEKDDSPVLPVKSAMTDVSSDLEKLRLKRLVLNILMVTLMVMGAALLGTGIFSVLGLGILAAVTSIQMMIYAGASAMGLSTILFLISKKLIAINKNPDWYGVTNKLNNFSTSKIQSRFQDRRSLTSIENPNMRFSSIFTTPLKRVPRSHSLSIPDQKFEPVKLERSLSI